MIRVQSQYGTFYCVLRTDVEENKNSDDGTLKVIKMIIGIV